MSEGGGASLEAIAAIAAIVVSIFTWLHSNQTEKRIRNESDRRLGFDASVSVPFASKLDPLDGILREIVQKAKEKRDPSHRTVAISELQRASHGEWFLEIEAFISALDHPYSKIIKAECFAYIDHANFLIEDISNAVDIDHVERRCHELRTHGDRYMARSRGHIHRWRSSIRGTHDSVATIVLRYFRN